MTDLQIRQIQFIGDKILSGAEYDLSKIPLKIKKEVDKYVQEHQKENQDKA